MCKRKRNHLTKHLSRHLASPSPRLSSVQQIFSSLPSLNFPCFHHILCSVPPSYFCDQWEVQKVGVRVQWFLFAAPHFLLVLLASYYSSALAWVAHELQSLIRRKKVDDAFFKNLEKASCSQALILMQDFSHPDTCWKDNIAGYKQSRQFMEYSDNNFLTEMIEDRTGKAALLDRTLIRKDWTQM